MLYSSLLPRVMALFFYFYFLDYHVKHGGFTGDWKEWT
jgi:hypothetical protein